jgi:hypothetical protein
MFALQGCCSVAISLQRQIAAGSQFLVASMRSRITAQSTACGFKNQSSSGTYTDEPDKIFAQVGIWISNGGREAPIVAEVETLVIELNGIVSPTSKNYIPMRLLPNQRKRFLSDRLDNIPPGNTSGEISYSLKYGPVSGFPVYRRMHKIRIQLRMPITPDLIRNGLAPGMVWTELEPELDTDVYPPPPA